MEDQIKEAVEVMRDAVIGNGVCKGVSCRPDSLCSCRSDASAALTARHPAIKDVIEGKGAAHDVLAERKRQQSAEGWTPDHDDHYTAGELAAAAACYAYFGWMRTGRAPTEWPWASEWWKPSDRRRDLVKAGALILAEIERLDRAMLAAAKDTSHD